MNIFSNGLDARGYFKQLYGKCLISQVERYDGIIREFKRQFGYADCHLASASGRVEFVGNHTDHNGGLVVGCAVNKDIIAAFQLNDSDNIRIKSDKHSAIEFDVLGKTQLNGGVGLAQGVVEYLCESGFNVGGFDAYTHSVVLGGAGISSSAAFEMLIAAIINVAFNNGQIPAGVMAKAGQYAENKYLNKPCGLLDQGSSLVGGLSRFDFKSGFSYNSLSVNNLKLKFALVDTGKSHANLSRLYASIPEEMFAVARRLGKDRLIDVDEQEFYASEEQLRKKFGNRPVNRARHFFEENRRVVALSSALEQGDVNEVIRIVNQSGDSSMNLLENCAVDENDTAICDAISFARGFKGVGARVHGGGFAGTVLCVASENTFPELFAALRSKYGEDKVLPMRIRTLGATVL